MIACRTYIYSINTKPEARTQVTIFKSSDLLKKQHLCKKQHRYSVFLKRP